MLDYVEGEPHKSTDAENDDADSINLLAGPARGKSRNEVCIDLASLRSSADDIKLSLVLFAPDQCPDNECKLCEEGENIEGLECFHDRSVGSQSGSHSKETNSCGEDAHRRYKIPNRMG